MIKDTGGAKQPESVHLERPGGEGAVVLPQSEHI